MGRQTDRQTDIGESIQALSTCLSATQLLAAKTQKITYKCLTKPTKFADSTLYSDMR